MNLKSYIESLVESCIEEEEPIEEELIGTSGGVRYFQMGGSLPKNLYNRKDGKGTKEVGSSKFRGKIGKSSSKKIEDDLSKKKKWYTKEAVSYSNMVKYLNSNSSYKILGNAGTWNAGGCGILALAFIKAQGLPMSRLYAVVDQASSEPEMIQHYVVKLGKNSYLDADGVQSKQQLLNKMEKVEFLRYPSLIPASKGYNEEIPLDVSKIKRLALKLRPLVAESAAENEYPEDYFEVDDNILFGKYKNKKGKISGFSKDEKGNPTIEVKPTPKEKDGKQKKPVEMGLFKVWKNDKEITEAFYHGTTASLLPGEYVLPPSETGKVSERGRKKNLDRVFVTKDLGSAKIYAGRAKHSLGGTPSVYLVEPEGDVATINDNPGTTVFSSPRAKVLKKII